ncbi:MAG: hypothetical protein NT150_01000 [Bacteroidetes bacterium]|nr:hypothetical protein [Bacteroidota bacterium]
MKKLSILLASCMLVLFSCKKENVDDKKDDNQNNNNTTSPQQYTVKGVVQKGPFVSGTEIELNEMTSAFVQTGKSFKSTIKDDKGSFELKDITLVSGYVLLSADGYYFNEVSGAASSGKLNLQCVADLSDSATVNVNILTHLQKDRILYLIEHDSKTFAQAKAQASQELLDIFSIPMPSGMTASLGDISQSGEVNGIILAMAVVMQGYNSTADLTQFLSNFSTDIREDGTLNSPTLQTQLINAAKLINKSEIRTNIENKYLDLGVTSAVIPDFETYVDLFASSTSFLFTDTVVYPQSSTGYGTNILNLEDSTFLSSTVAGITANVPKGGKLKIKITAKETNLWSVNVGYSNGYWTNENFNFGEKSQVFTINTAEVLADFKIAFEASGSAKIEIFENGATTPTRTKYVQW